MKIAVLNWSLGKLFVFHICDCVTISIGLKQRKGNNSLAKRFQFLVQLSYSPGSIAFEIFYSFAGVIHFTISVERPKILIRNKQPIMGCAQMNRSLCTYSFKVDKQEFVFVGLPVHSSKLYKTAKLEQSSLFIAANKITFNLKIRQRNEQFVVSYCAQPCYEPRQYHLLCVCLCAVPTSRWRGRQMRKVFRFNVLLLAPIAFFSRSASNPASNVDNFVRSRAYGDC